MNVGMFGYNSILVFEVVGNFGFNGVYFFNGIRFKVQGLRCMVAIGSSLREFIFSHRPTQTDTDIFFRFANGY